MTRATPLLPHQTDDIFLTDGGTETWLMYKRGFELPEFSAFHLLNEKKSADALREYYNAFAEVAVKLGTPFIFDSLTYRASRDWGTLLGYSTDSLAEMNHKCFELYRECLDRRKCGSLPWRADRDVQRRWRRYCYGVDLEHDSRGCWHRKGCSQGRLTVRDRLHGRKRSQAAQR